MLSLGLPRTQLGQHHQQRTEVNLLQPSCFLFLRVWSSAWPVSQCLKPCFTYCGPVSVCL